MGTFAFAANSRSWSICNGVLNGAPPSHIAAPAFCRTIEANAVSRSASVFTIADRADRNTPPIGSVPFFFALRPEVCRFSWDGTAEPPMLYNGGGSW